MWKKMNTIPTMSGLLFNHVFEAVLIGYCGVICNYLCVAVIVCYFGVLCYFGGVMFIWCIMKQCVCNCITMLLGGIE